MLSALRSVARERPLVLIAWLLAFMLAWRFAGADLGYALRHGGWNAAPGTLLGRDFVNVFTAGQLVLEGKLKLVYDVGAYEAYQADLFGGAVRDHNYSYSPVSFFYVWLFALGPYGLCYWLWIGLTGGAFLLAARPYLRGAGLPAWAALLIPAAVANVWAGHYGFLFGALWLSAWRLVDTRPRTAGILIGLMIVKPHLALLMPIALARRGSWTAILYAALTSLTLVAASGLAFGWSYWATYLTETSAVQAAMIEDTGQFFLRMMPTVLPAMLLAGLGSTAAWIVQGAFASGAAVALWKRLPSDPMQAGLAAATATFLALPYAFNYDLTVVGIAALIALHRTGVPVPLGERCVAALAFLLPLLVISMNGLGVPLAPLVLAALLATMLRREQPRAAALPTPLLASA
jgi:alpha-1,2-mannosyltransferase